MIEVAYALGRGQPLVLVVNNYSWPGVIIDGEAITERYEIITLFLVS